MLSTRTEMLMPSSLGGPGSARPFCAKRTHTGGPSGAVCAKGTATWSVARRPQSDDVVLADDGHLDPALLVVRSARVGGGEVVIRRDHAAHLVQRLGARLAREHFVLDSVAADAFV